jgi:CRISPR/Cas system CSM-associated protein Csm3 (group 7 of RAMP superfamily)
MDETDINRHKCGAWVVLDNCEVCRIEAKAIR